MKKKEKTMLVIILAIALLLASQGLLPFVISGVPDSDLLLLSGTPTILEGQSQPLLGNVVMAEFLVGIGNDVAAVGSYDQEKIIVSKPDILQTNYFVTAKKTKMNTQIGVVGNKKLLRNTGFKQSGTKNGYGIGTIIQSDAEVQASLKIAAQNAYNMMKNELGSELLAFSWRPIEQSDVPVPYGYSNHCICQSTVLAGICATGWLPQVYWVAYEFGSGTIEYQSFGAKQANVQVDVSLTNKDGKITDTLVLAQGDCGSNCRTEGYLYDNGTTVGYAKIVGLLPSFQLPLDLTDEAPALIGGTRQIVSKNYADTAWGKLLDLDLASQTFSDPNGNTAVIESAVASYKSSYASVYDSRRFQFNNKWGFTYDVGSQAYVINDAYTGNPVLQTIVLGDWIGLIRDVAEFQLECGGSVSGYEGSSLNSNVKVKNVSTVNGSYTLSWNCPTGSNSIMDTLSANGMKNYNVSFNLSRPETGTCTIQLNYGDNLVSCGIGYEFKEAPQACGNGRVDSGENCENCPVDVRCAAHEACINKACTALTTCGNGLIDVGENCDNCPIDLETVYGEGYCAPTFPWSYLILAIVLVVGALFALSIMKKKKKRKPKRRRR